MTQNDNIDKIISLY